MADFVDPAIRIERLARRLEPGLQSAFLRFAREAESRQALEQLAALLESGRVDVAIREVTRAFDRFTIEVNDAFVVSGKETAAVLRGGLDLRVGFDQVNDGAVRAMAANKLRMVREFSEGQRQAVHEALVRGVSAGRNPIDIARDFRQSIGLTRKQEAAVLNYRRLLETSDADALRRELRDRRFDGSVRRAVSGDRQLKPAQVDRMVERYRERYLVYRSEVIARSEALRAAHQGNEEAYRQAYESGELSPGDVVQEWNTAKDEKVRPSHAFMHGQQRPPGEPFLSGDGNHLRYPGDPDAPAEDTVQCRCAVGTRIAIQTLSET